jgi:UDP-N-acetyl-2-amino-2-deoxyglucuronate dehydrogenase
VTAEASGGSPTRNGRAGDRRLRIGVVGAGIAAGWFVDLLRHAGDAECVAALRAPGGDLDEAAERLGVRTLDDADAFYGLGLDAVVVTSPSGLHAEHATAALEHGCHVLVEKPITITGAAGERLVALAQQRDLRLGVVFQRRADPVFRHVAAAIHGGALGTVVAAGLTLPYHRGDAYYASAAWRGTWALDGGGVLMNQGIHLLDVLVWWFGDPDDVRAFAATQARAVEVEDTAAVALRFGPGPAVGALGTVLATTASSPGHPHALDVLGTRGSVRLEGERVVRWDVEGVPAPPASEAADGGARDPRATDTTNHGRVLADFLEAIRERRAPLVDGREGLRSLAFVERVYRAAGLR